MLSRKRKLLLFGRSGSVDIPESILLLGQSVAEDAAIGTTVGTLFAVGSTGTATFALVDSAGGKFSIVGNALKTAALLDYETATSHNIIISASGTTPVTPNKAFTINVTDVFEAAPVIQLTGTTVNEDAAVNTTVGTLSIANAFTGTPVYTLTDSAGGKFNISGALLRVNAALDFETATTHDVTVHVTGITPTAADKVFTVVVLDITEGGAYQGPGDVKAGALGWWGLRAYSAAQCTGSVKAIQVVKSTDSTFLTDINIKTDGSLDVAAVTALGYPVKVSKLYDQSGNGRDLIAVNITAFPNIPDFDPVGIGGTKPCLNVLATSRLQNASGLGAVAQPFSISLIGQRTSSSGAYEGIFSPDSTFGLLGNNTTNGVLMYTGSSLAVTTVADAAIHTGQFVFNGATGFSNIDGTSATKDVGNTTGWSAGAISLFNNGIQNASIGKFFEIGFWGSAFSAGDATSITTNQANYLAGTGGGGGTTKNIVTDYGAVGDAQWVSQTFTINRGSTTLTCNSATPFVAGDVGKAIVVSPMPFGSPIFSTIATFVSSSVVTLNHAPPANWSADMSSRPNVIVSWGTNNGKTVADGGINGPFETFRLAYQNQSVTLTIPAGKYLISNGNFLGLWNGIRNITVNASGATICGDTFQIQANAFYNTVGRSGYTANVSAGSMYVTLLTPSDVSKFFIGRYAMMSGFDMQNLGEPCNHARHEYHKITAIDSDTGSPTYGRITFLEPLKYAYKSTWPLYTPEGTLPNPQTMGGPGTLYQMRPEFDHTCVINNLSVASGNQYGGSGLSLTFNNCIFEGVGQVGPHPTMAKSITYNNCTGNGMTLEVDKICELVTLTGGSWQGLYVQSSSINELILDNVDVQFSVFAPRKLVIKNGCSIGTLIPGPVTYGHGDVLEVRDSAIGTFGDATYHSSGFEIRSGDGSGDGVEKDFTMAAGVITVPASMRWNMGLSQWAIESGRMHFWDANLGSLGIFTITDVTDIGTAIKVYTNWTRNSGNFPPSTYTAGGLWMKSHVANDCTFVAVSGCDEAGMMSNLPANIPLYSRYYNGFGSVTALTTPYWQLYGRIKSVIVNVITAYTGATGVVKATLLFGNATVRMSDFASVVWNPVIDLKTAGMRTFSAPAIGSYPASWTGGAGADVLTGMPSAQWSTSNFRIIVDTFAAGTGPLYTVDIICDQGP